MIGTVSAKSIKDGMEHARADRSLVETTWQDVLYYVMPRKRDIQYELSKGEKAPHDVYDDTAVQANITLAAGLSGYMTNAAQRWFELRATDERLMEKKGVREFFNDASEVMYSALAHSNFYNQVHELYLDLGAIGTAAMYTAEDEKDDIRFYTRHPKEIFLVENERGEVDMVYRSFKMTAWAAYNFFGKDKCGKSVIKDLENKNYNKESDFIQHICPRHVREVGKIDATNKPFASYWVSEADNKICRESGFDYFPFSTPRFYKNSNMIYGYSPGISCYSDIKMLNKMGEYYIKGAETSIWPPMVAQHDSIMGTFSLKAGAMNYQNAPMNQGLQIQPIDIKMKYQVALDFINRVENKINGAFFADLFLSITQGSNMTATEVIERTQEKMLLLGPVLGRLQNELLDPVVTNTFRILGQRGKLPDVPQALLESGASGKEGMFDFDIMYVSPLAKAQRAAQGRDIQTFLALVGQMAAVAPNVLDKVDTDAAVDKMSTIYSVDPDILRDEEEVDLFRKARAQQEQQAAQMAMAQGAANIADTATKAGKQYAESRPE